MIADGSDKEDMKRYVLFILKIERKEGEKGWLNEVNCEVTGLEG